MASTLLPVDHTLVVRTFSLIPVWDQIPFHFKFEISCEWTSTQDRCLSDRRFAYYITIGDWLIVLNHAAVLSVPLLNKCVIEAVHSNKCPVGILISSGQQLNQCININYWPMIMIIVPYWKWTRQQSYIGTADSGKGKLTIQTDWRGVLHRLLLLVPDLIGPSRMGSDRSMMVNDFDLTARQTTDLFVLLVLEDARDYVFLWSPQRRRLRSTYIHSGGPLHTVTSCVHKRTLLLLDDDVVCEEWEREEIHPIRHKDRGRVALGNGIWCWCCCW